MSGKYINIGGGNTPQVNIYIYIRKYIYIYNNNNNNSWFIDTTAVTSSSDDNYWNLGFPAKDIYVYTYIYIKVGDTCQVNMNIYNWEENVAVRLNL